MKLYDYYRSTACYRVRIALQMKHIPYDIQTVHLINEGGAHHHPDYHAVNPQELVPSIETNGHVLTQSLAMIEYLEETYPDVPLLPQEPIKRAAARSLALMIACDMHPLNNLRVLNQLKQQFKASESEVQAWYHHWLKAGFDAFEARLTTLDRSIPVCLGDSITLADICLIPQIYNAHRFQFPMEAYPLINEINAYCLTLEAFQKAGPDSLSDAL